MDEATKRQRARNKIAMGKRGQMPEYEARGLGRKNRPNQTFPAQQCSHVIATEHPNGPPRVLRDGSTKPQLLKARCAKTAVESKMVASKHGGKTRRAFCAEHSRLYKSVA